MTSPRSFKPAEQKNSYPDLWKKMLESKTKFPVIHATWDKPKEMTIAELIEEKRKEGKNLVFTGTPGPFLDFKRDLTEQEQDEWMNEKKQDAKGCTFQLQAVDEEISKSNDTDVIAINIQASDTQLAILRNKDRKMGHLFMMSDPNLKFVEEFAWPLLQLKSGRKCMGRLTVAVKLGKEAKDDHAEVMAVERGQEGLVPDTAKRHAEKAMQCMMPAQKAALTA